MTQGNVSFAVFVDYDNLGSHKTAGILDVVTKALIQIPMDLGTSTARCEVRIYGGWYEGTQLTRLGQEVAVEIQRDFPKVIRLPGLGGGHVSVSATAELAVALLAEPGHHLFNTFQRKGKPSNVRVVTQTEAGCNEQDCILPLMKELLGTGRCPKAGCAAVTTNMIYRNEQKLVDTMLACDMIHAAGGLAEYIILVSGDEDFLPPLRVALLHGVKVVRFYPKPNSQRHPHPPGGSQLLELDL